MLRTLLLILGVVSSVTAEPAEPRLGAGANRAASADPATSMASGLPIINDDYERARAEAVKRHLPLFVEVWAPW